MLICLHQPEELEGWRPHPSKAIEAGPWEPERPSSFVLNGSASGRIISCFNASATLCMFRCLAVLSCDLMRMNLQLPCSVELYWLYTESDQYKAVIRSLCILKACWINGTSTCPIISVMSLAPLGILAPNLMF